MSTSTTKLLTEPISQPTPGSSQVLYDVFLDGNEHLNVTKAVSDMLKSLNIRAGANALDLMNYDDLRNIVEEAKPPKE